MKGKSILGLAIAALAGCTTTGVSERPVGLRVQANFIGWQFNGSGFTPDANVALSILGAPVPCGTSYCADPYWQPIGTLKAGPVGGVWPNDAGAFQRDITTQQMAARRGDTVTCYPGQSWGIQFKGEDGVTGKIGAASADASPFFQSLPRCR